MDNRIYGYARVSSREQNEDRQIEALTKFGVPPQNIITDKCSGKDTEREGYQYLKHQILRSGDTLVILRAIANRNNDLQSAVFDGGRRYAPLSAPLYALCQSHIVALAAAAQPANHNIVVICNRGQYIKELDRLSRNKSDIKNELEYFKSIGVRVKILDIPTTLTDFPDEQLWVMDMINAILIEVLGSIAENERNKIRSRQREGIEAAKKKKIALGRPALVKPANFEAVCARVEAKEMTVAQAVKILQISRSSYYRLQHRIV